MSGSCPIPISLVGFTIGAMRLPAMFIYNKFSCSLIMVEFVISILQLKWNGVWVTLSIFIACAYVDALFPNTACRAL